MGAAEEKVAAFLRAGVVSAVAGVLRDGGGQPVEATAEAIVDLFDREAVQPLAAEVERLRGILHTVREGLDDEKRKKSSPEEDGPSPDFWLGRSWGVTVAMTVLDEALRAGEKP